MYNTKHNYIFHYTCTGQAGVFTASNGLQVAYLSGTYSEQDYTASTENKSLVGFGYCDLLYIHVMLHIF